MQVELTDGSIWETGCYIDGWWGQYKPDRLVKMAEDLGWKARDSSPDAARFFRICDIRLDNMGGGSLGELQHADDILYSDWVDGVCDDAADYLNSLIAGDEPMFTFGWYDGEFYLWHNSEWEET